MTTVCLCMIVKNEAHVIERCLASVRPWITTWVVVDTGSTDGTQDVIRSALAGIPGEVIERPWRDFAHNRTEALAFARGRADYVLVIDADDVLRPSDGFTLPTLEHDSYRLRVRYGAISFNRAHLLRDARTWRYEGVLHEHAVADDARTMSVLDGLEYVIVGGGARSRDPHKYLRDVDVLRAALVETPRHPRYQFYLAQSYRDAGDAESALRAYQVRIELGGWDEEVFCAQLQIAKLLEQLGKSSAEVTGAYLSAYQLRPQRAESLYELARYCRQRGDLALAYLFAQAAVAIRRPDDHLFVDDSVYAWRALDELAVAAAAVGDTGAASLALERLAASPDIPVLARRRCVRNLAILSGTPADRSGDWLHRSGQPLLPATSSSGGRARTARSA